MYPAGNLLIPISHGQLEAIIKHPHTGEVRGVALVLHPHPLFGGTMHNKVVFRAASALNDAGLVTLRINFRGVGQSTGEHDEGRGELEDVQAGLRYLEEKYPDHRITLCGFSFGARVGLEVGASDERVVDLISIGTPVNKYDFSFLTACRKPLLFVHGDRDEFGDVEKLRQLVDEIKLNPGTTTQGGPHKSSEKESVQLVLIKGAGHFFEAHLDEMKKAITDWITKQLA